MVNNNSKVDAAQLETLLKDLHKREKISGRGQAELLHVVHNVDSSPDSVTRTINSLYSREKITGRGRQEIFSFLKLQ